MHDRARMLTTLDPRSKESRVCAWTLSEPANKLERHACYRYLDCFHCPLITFRSEASVNATAPRSSDAVAEQSSWRYRDCALRRARFPLAALGGSGDGSRPGTAVVSGLDPGRAGFGGDGSWRQQITEKIANRAERARRRVDRVDVFTVVQPGNGGGFRGY